MIKMPGARVSSQRIEPPINLSIRQITRFGLSFPPKAIESSPGGWNFDCRVFMAYGRGGLAPPRLVCVATNTGCRNHQIPKVGECVPPNWPEVSCLHGCWERIVRQHGPHHSQIQCRFIVVVAAFMHVGESKRAGHYFPPLIHKLRWGWLSLFQRRATASLSSTHFACFCHSTWPSQKTTFAPLLWRVPGGFIV